MAFAKSEVFAGRPAIFDSDKHSDDFSEHVRSQLGTAQRVLIVGSAKTGFSLDPDGFPAPFGDHSDIDVVIIDPQLFDDAWRVMLAWDYLTTKDGRSKTDHYWLASRRMEIFNGWFVPIFWDLQGRSQVDLSLPIALKPLRDLASLWLKTFRSLARYRSHPEIPRHPIKARLYRTETHAAMYHASGLKVLRRKLLEQAEKQNAV